MSPESRFSSTEYLALFDRIDAVRGAREAFLSQVEAGEVELKSIFLAAQDDPVISGMKVLPAIEGLPDMGKVQTRRAFGDSGIGEGDHIGSVSPESLAGLPEALERHKR